MSEAVLVLEDVHKAYAPGTPGEVVVLRGAAIAIAPGELVALTAPSGAGKSTLLHIAGLLDHADRGRVVLMGAEMTGAGDGARTRARRRQVGFVYQFHHLLAEFSALENVSLPMRIAGRGREAARGRAMELLEAVGLGARAGHRPAELSGGEAQRVAIARALANDPALLLADEPTGNLDPATAQRVFSLLVEMARARGLAALIATHNPELAARMDRVVTLREGRIEAA